MLNYIWAFMILFGVIYAACTGQMDSVTNAALDSAGEAISLCITMAGVMALWMGLMEIAQKAGLIKKMTRGIGPFLRFMFPRIPQGHPALGYIATNIIANVLGLGWACTPAGLKAMEALSTLEEERGNPEYTDNQSLGPKQSVEMTGNTNDIASSKANLRTPAATGKKNGIRRKENTITIHNRERSASNEMCTFLILNISSLQLIPVNMIAYRSQYGSANPAGIIAPAIMATSISTLIALVYCKMKDRKKGI